MIILLDWRDIFTWNICISRRQPFWILNRKFSTEILFAYKHLCYFVLLYRMYVYDRLVLNHYHWSYVGLPHELFRVAKQNLVFHTEFGIISSFSSECYFLCFYAKFFETKQSWKENIVVQNSKTTKYKDFNTKSCADVHSLR